MARLSAWRMYEMGIFKERYKEGLAYWVTVYGRGPVSTNTPAEDKYIKAQFSWNTAQRCGWLRDTKSGFQITDAGISFAFEENQNEH